jgi:hypothetical protein
MYSLKRALFGSLALGLPLLLLARPSGRPSFWELSAQAKEVAPVYEQALRNRVEQFYSLMQLSRFADAEVYVTEATRQNFIDQPKGPFLSFEISTIKFEAKANATPDKAEVTVQQEVFVPPAPAPIRATSVTTWIRIGDTWMLQAPKVDIPTFTKLFDRKPKGPRPPPPPVEVKFDKESAEMGKVTRGQKGFAHFKFKNISDHPVSLEINTYCDCLTVKNLKPEYKAGESGEITVELDSTEFLEEYMQTIMVKTLPGTAETRLLISG